LNRIKYVISAFLLASFIGCADMPVPSPDYIMERPIGTSSVKVGMTKDKVKEVWGEPYQINFVEDKEKWGGAREEWVYKAYSDLPVNAGYLSKTKRLYFDGDNLTNIVEVEKK
jgi:hypothetical protein